MSSASRKIIFASAFGNALEFYDFTLYGVFTAIIANQYFPGGNETTRLLTSLLAFAVGFFTRPIGAILFGHIGDKYGRRQALSLSILLMGIPTFAIGISPTYEQIGLSASFLIFGCRLLQGIFTGGEYNGAAIFSIEHIGKKSPGFVGGLITSSCVIGAYLATLFGTLTQIKGMPDWAWRLPFIFGASISLIGFFIRRRIMETPEYILAEEQGLKSKVPLLKAIKTNTHACLITFMLGGLNGALSYTLFGFLNIYLSRYLDIPLVLAMQLNLLGLLAFMVGSPIMGYILDVIGQKKFLIYAITGILILAIPMFMALSTQALLPIIIGQVLLGLCTASIAGSGHAVMQSLFPVTDRYSGIAFNFSLGMGLLGGITPILYVDMIEKHHVSLLFPAFFLMGLAFLFSLTLVKSPVFKRQVAVFE